MLTRRTRVKSALLLPAAVGAPVLSARGAAVQPLDFQATELPYQQPITDIAEGWRAKYGLPGVWCAYLRNGCVAAMVTTGYRNVETKAPARLQDHLPVGSISKVLAGSMLAFFVAAGTVRYETMIGEVFPEMARQHSDSPLSAPS